MSTLISRPAGRRWPLLLTLLLLTAPAFANSITIGKLTFLSSGDPNHPQHRSFLLELNTQDLVFERDNPGMPHSLVFDVQGFGLFSTLPPTYTLLRPVGYCPCEAWVFNMSLLYAGPFRLANGKLFYPSSTITVSFYPPPGQTYLQYGQTVDIVLNSQPSPVPEPASLLLVANGLLVTAGVVWRKRRAIRQLSQR